MSVKILLSWKHQVTCQTKLFLDKFRKSYEGWCCLQSYRYVQSHAGAEMWVKVSSSNSSTPSRSSDHPWSCLEYEQSPIFLKDNKASARDPSACRVSSREAIFARAHWNGSLAFLSLRKNKGLLVVLQCLTWSWFNMCSFHCTFYGDDHVTLWHQTKTVAKEAKQGEEKLLKVHQLWPWNRRNSGHYRCKVFLECLCLPVASKSQRRADIQQSTAERITNGRDALEPSLSTCQSTWTRNWARVL